MNNLIIARANNATGLSFKGYKMPIGVEKLRKTKLICNIDGYGKITHSISTGNYYFVDTLHNKYLLF